MNELKHTPLPYSSDDEWILDAQGDELAECAPPYEGTSTDTAAFLALAANSHYDLLAACEMVRARVGHWLTDVELKSLDAAIAKAKPQVLAQETK